MLYGIDQRIGRQILLDEYYIKSPINYAVEHESVVIGDFGHKSVTDVVIKAGESYDIDIPESKGVIVMCDGVVENPAGSGSSQVSVQISDIGYEMDNPLKYVTYGAGKSGATGHVAAHPESSINKITLTNDSDVDIKIGTIDIKYIAKTKNNPVAMYFRYTSFPARQNPYNMYQIDIPLMYPGIARLGMFIRKVIPKSPVSGGEAPAIWCTRLNTVYSSHSPKNDEESWIADWMFDSRPVEGVNQYINGSASNIGNTPGLGNANGVTMYMSDNTYNFQNVETYVYGYAVIYQFIKPGKTWIRPPDRIIRDAFIFLHRNPVDEFSTFIVPPYGSHVRLVRMWSDKTYDYSIQYAWNEGADGVGSWLNTLSSATGVSGLNEVDTSSKPYMLYKVTMTLSASGYARIIAYMS